MRDAYARGDSAAVIEAAAGAEDSFIVHANTVVLVARSLGTLGRTREAIELLKQAHAANPEQLALGRWCGRLAAVEGDYATALRMYGSLDRDDPAFAAAAPEVERFFAWLQAFRRLLVRWEVKAENYLGFVNLACVLILLRHTL